MRRCRIGVACVAGLLLELEPMEAPTDSGSISRWYGGAKSVGALVRALGVVGAGADRMGRRVMVGSCSRSSSRHERGVRR